MVPPNAKVLDETLDKSPSWSSQFKNSAFHLGSHPKYTSLVSEKIIEIKKMYSSGIISQSEAYEEVIELTERIKALISNGNGKTINDIKL